MPLVIEAIPDLVILIGIFFALCAYLVCRGLLAAWVHTFGGLLEWLGAHLAFTIPIVHKTVDFGGVFRAADTAVWNILQGGASASEYAIGRGLYGIELLARMSARATEYLARETAATFDWLLERKLPAWAQWIIAGAVPPLLLAKLLRSVMTYVRAHIHSVTRVIRQEIPARAAHIAAAVVPVVLPGAVALPGLRHEVAGLGRWAWRANRRLRRLELLLGATAMAAAMANALGLGRAGARCIRRGNIGRLARFLCFLDPILLSPLFGIGVAALTVLELCQYAQAAQAFARAAAPELAPLLLAEDAVCLGGGATFPSAYQQPAGSTRILAASAQ